MNTLLRNLRYIAVDAAHLALDVVEHFVNCYAPLPESSPGEPWTTPEFADMKQRTADALAEADVPDSSPAASAGSAGVGPAPASDTPLSPGAGRPPPGTSGTGSRAGGEGPTGDSDPVGHPLIARWRTRATALAANGELRAAYHLRFAADELGGAQ